MKRTFEGALNVRVINDFLNISGGDLNVDVAAIGTPQDSPNDNTVIGLLKNEKQSLTEVNQKTGNLSTNLGTTDDDSDSETVIGILKNEKDNVNSLKTSVGSTADPATQNTVIGLLKSIIQNFE